MSKHRLGVSASRKIMFAKTFLFSLLLAQIINMGEASGYLRVLHEEAEDDNVQPLQADLLRPRQLLGVEITKGPKQGSEEKLDSKEHDDKESKLHEVCVDGVSIGNYFQ